MISLFLKKGSQLACINSKAPFFIHNRASSQAPYLWVIASKRINFQGNLLNSLVLMVVGGKGKGKPVRGQKPTRGGPKQFTNTTELSRQTDEINNNWKHRDQKESSSEDEEEEEKVPIIEVNNPNAPKKNIKLGDLSSGAGEKVELSRRERYFNYNAGLFIVIQVHYL